MSLNQSELSKCFKFVTLLYYYFLIENKCAVDESLTERKYNVTQQYRVSLPHHGNTPSVAVGHGCPLKRRNVVISLMLNSNEHGLNDYFNSPSICNLKVHFRIWMICTWSWLLHHQSCLCLRDKEMWLLLLLGHQMDDHDRRNKEDSNSKVFGKIKCD